jgi:hypothetical protein
VQRDQQPVLDSVLAAVTAALLDVVSKDAVLLKLRAHEVAVVHRFGVYLENPGSDHSGQARTNRLLEKSFVVLKKYHEAVQDSLDAAF